jgi:hypothetical protein
MLRRSHHIDRHEACDSCEAPMFVNRPNSARRIDGDATLLQQLTLDDRSGISVLVWVRVDCCSSHAVSEIGIIDHRPVHGALVCMNRSFKPSRKQQQQPKCMWHNVAYHRLSPGDARRPSERWCQEAAV